MRKDSFEYIVKLFEKIAALSIQEQKRFERIGFGASDEEPVPISFEDQVDVLVPVLGKTQLDEYKIRKILFELAYHRKPTEDRKKAREILHKVYNCTIVDAEEI